MHATKLWTGLLLGLFSGLSVVVAQQPFTAGVPSGAVQFFDRTTATGCPSGWTELTAARGYHLTGLVASGTRGVAVGTALTDQEDRHHVHTITHDHTFTVVSGATANTAAKRVLAVEAVATGGHTHTLAGTTGASSQANTSNESTVILPHVQELACKKN